MSNKTPKIHRLKKTSTAGYILNAGRNATEPGPLTRKERTLLRDLARKVKAVAELPVQADKRNLWYRHIALEPVRPMRLMFLEDCWEEVFPPEGNLLTKDNYWRQWEWHLRHLLFRHEHLDDDFVIEPDLYVPVRLKTSGRGISNSRSERTDNPHGSYNWTPSLSDPNDIRKLRTTSFNLDTDGFEREMGAVQDVFSDIIPVHRDCAPSSFCLVDTAANLRGTLELMIDMFDRPEWVHELMAFLGNEEMRKRRRVSVSPFCDVDRAAAELTDRYIFSWKPNPAILVGQFDESRLRSTIRHTLDVARDCRLEIIMKDTITLDGEPWRLKAWARILREEITSYWGM